MAVSHEIVSHLGYRTISTGLVVPATHTISRPVLADIDGNGLRDLCTKVYSGTNRDRAELHFFDLEMRQTIATLPISRHPTDILPADLEGDGSKEIILINNAFYAGRALGLELFRWDQDKIAHTTHREFTGIDMRIGDLDGDGKDEIILCELLPYGHTNLGGTGPIRIKVLSWNRKGFESIAKVDFPTAYFQIYVGDLDNDGRDEIAVLRSGSPETPEGIQPPQLGVYTYTGNFELTLRDEIEFPIPYLDNLTRIWGIPLPDNKIRLLVPIPIRIAEDLCLGFRLENQKLIKERDVYTISFWGYQSAQSPIFYRPLFNRMDVNLDNKYEVLRTFDVGLKRHLRFIEEPVPYIRTIALPTERQVQSWKSELLEGTEDSILMHGHIEGHLAGLPYLPWPKSIQELLLDSLEEYDTKINSVYWQKRIAEGTGYGCEECVVSLLKMARFQVDPDFQPIFIKYLDLSSWPAEGLAALGPRAFEPVMEIIEQNEPSRHYRAAETLGLLFRNSSILYKNIETRERAVLGLMKLVRSRWPATRRAAIESFRYINDKRAVALLDSIAQADIYEVIREKAHEVSEGMQEWREEGSP